MKRKLKKKKILIIDDEKDFCHFVKLNLGETGKFEVLTTTKAAEGIDLAKSDQPDLILLDILMPEMNGTQTAQYLIEDPLTRKIPIVFLTVLALKEEVKKGLGTIGGRIFIAKPVTPAELIARIELFFQKE